MAVTQRVEEKVRNKGFSLHNKLGTDNPADMLTKKRGTREDDEVYAGVGSVLAWR